MNQMFINQPLSWDFSDFKTEVSNWKWNGFCQRSLCGGHFQPTQNREIVGDYCTPDVLLKPFPSPPGAASKAESTLEPGDVCFNTGAKISQPFVHPMAFNHIQDRQPSLFGKHYVCDTFALGPVEVVLRSEATIGCKWPGRCCT